MISAKEDPMTTQSFSQKEPGLFASFYASLPTPTDRVEAIVLLGIGAALTACISLMIT
jgi:hypothetical protein